MLKREIVPPPEHLYPARRVADHRGALVAAVLGASRDDLRAVQRLPRHARHLRRGPACARARARTSTASTRPGRSSTPRRPTAWPGSARRSSTLPDATVLELFVDDEPLFLPTARVTRVRPGARHARRHPRRATSSGRRRRQARRRPLAPAGVARAPAPRGHRRYEVTIDHAGAGRHRSRVVQPRCPRPSVTGDAAASTADPRLGRRSTGDRVLDPASPRTTTAGSLLGYQTTNSRMTLAVGVEHVVETPAPHRVDLDGRPRLTPRWCSRSRPSRACRSAMVKYVTYQTSRSVAPPATWSRVAHRTLDRVLARRLRRPRRRPAAQPRPVLGPGRRAWSTRPRARRASSRRCAGTSSSWPGVVAGRGRGHPGQGPHRAAPTTATTSGTPRRTCCRSSPTPSPASPGTCCASATACCPRRASGPRALGLRGRAVPVADDQRRRGVGATTRPAPRSTTSTPTSPTPSGATSTSAATSGSSVEVGAEILVETARMWEDLGFYGDDGRFHLHGVTGPDEYTTVVNDNAFTNLMARLNLRYAAVGRPSARGRAARALRRPASRAEPRPDRDRRVGAGGRRRCTSPTTPSAASPRRTTRSSSRERWDLERHAAGEVPAAAALPPARHLPASGAQAGRRRHGDVPARQRVHDRAEAPELRLLRPAHHRRLVAVGLHPEHRRRRDRRRSSAAGRYFDFALLMDLADVAGNVSDGVHIAVGGRRLDGARVRLRRRPRLRRRALDRPAPPAPMALAGFSLRFQDRQLRITLTHDEERYLLEGGAPLDVTVRGQRRTLIAGEPPRMYAGRRMNVRPSAQETMPGIQPPKSPLIALDRDASTCHLDRNDSEPAVTRARYP